MIVLPANPALDASPEPTRETLRRIVPPDPARRRAYFSQPNVAPLPRLTAPPKSAPELVRLPLAFAASRSPAASSGLDPVDPIGFTAFLTWPEGAPELCEGSGEMWRGAQALAGQACMLRDAVMAGHEARAGPLSPRGFFEAARAVAAPVTTALLLCHLVARALARGGEAVTWRATDRQRGVFTDGTRLWRARAAGGFGAPGLFHSGLFYEVFDPAAFGTADNGNWYRFFGLASLTALASSAAVRVPTAAEEGPVLAFARTVDGVAARLAWEPDSDAHRGWVWANALHVAEYGRWSRQQRRAEAAAAVAAAGAAFGLSSTGSRPGSDWPWMIARAGALRDAPADPAGWFAGALTASSVAAV